ncbi:hypothetical protein A2334_04510 [Candidatus Roizmanbacteria bacterium RIFOXYB2_FULL_38_10]|uniref:HAD family hydrolase n=1 Tax=Candidatus Roizmanbacteria bacterium RIFOXYD1_FULL_38_12 TaxID=1802093 RepID=A0A1F7KZR1_9BACT|nr:MAG: hypothetical protein A3K47_00615 [Candidatus Roizmanbacteria bacterium RIFOXYA2_FULL_38_14]OGK63293.1 MAG: hypothetical protein A3K27_00615 [Candidatus Roizmanbacteria bacterium RIFOXYA1_FULL_37_12]OGK65139.1 MAG: hypothetical protein A3K38_00615 [Candidatus Roizmanbacteria bacterium RIFOXYB1_FULL_40_23]OGK68694.1 MAG: hypothetical protein A2334_04510 [Candidatus Roizmanbacteria bacterium RIFOXYB2_FULL_38_10]OGK69543.1 MAG: hypothetical protein A3K21_00615 [Candidatus Roizmanbacteria ba
MIKLIIFDWDDVLTLNAKEGYYNCYRKTINELGVYLDEKELDKRIKKRWGQPYREEIKEILKERPELVNKACALYQQHKFGPTYLDKVKEVPGIDSLLKKLSKEYLLAVATANQPKILQKIYEKFSIPKVFCQIVTAYDEDVPPEKTKPHPHMLELILNKQKIKSSEALFVGDAENDVLMAKNAGIEPVVVLTGHLSKEQADKLGVKYVLPDVTKLEEILF